MSTVISNLLGRDLAGIAFDPFREGVEIAVLQRDQLSDAPAVALLRYRPGAGVPLHEHTGTETICVLEGSQADDNGVYAAGDVVVNPTGSRHRVWSTTGCLVLIVWAAPVRILDETAPKHD